jgi:DNA-directed RNA polymerase I and III subunit RPAC1
LNPEKPVPPELAEKFAGCFASGVIKVHPRTKAVSVDEHMVRRETMAREVFRHPEFEGMCKLARVRDYFLCEFGLFGIHVLSLPQHAIAYVVIVNIESESAYKPERLVYESIGVMRSKIAGLRKAALALGGVQDGDVEMEG